MEFDAVPEQLLVSKNDLERQIVEYEHTSQRKLEFEKHSSFFCSTLVSIFALILSAPALSTTISSKLSLPFNTLPPEQIVSLILQIISLLGLAIFSIASLAKTIHYRKWRKTNVDLFQRIIDKTKENIQYTGIIIIADCSNRKNIRFLLGNSSKKEYKYFFPYIKMTPSLSVETQIESIKNHISQVFDISPSDITNVSALNPTPLFSIKGIVGNQYIDQHAFTFFNIQLNHGTKNHLLSRYSDNWMSHEEMQNTPDAMAYNKDVIGYMGDIMNNISDSFITISHPIKVIWNLTKKCSYSCAICATRDETRIELDFLDKMKVLHHLNSMKDRIVKIDFSGGDPCTNSDDLLVIKHAIDSFGSSKVSVTTTGKGIEFACRTDDCHEVVRNCEITIDALGSANMISRNTNEQYYDDNLRGVIDHVTYIHNLVINMPVICNTLSTPELNQVISNIKEIKNHGVTVKVNLLRLMPVGGMALMGYPPNYNPTETITQIWTELQKNNITVSAHCSLKVSKCLSVLSNKSPNVYCGMASKKVGIDCSGNVFSCGWAGYVVDENNKKQIMKPAENPFYLGNALDTKLSDILSNENSRYKNLNSRIAKSLNGKIKYCPVVSYAKNPRWYSNSDPLSKQN